MAKAPSWRNVTSGRRFRLLGQAPPPTDLSWKNTSSLNTSFLSYCVGSSEGSVVAYYLSEFNVPAGQEAAVDKAMSSMDKLVAKEQRTLSRPGNALVVEDVVSSGKVSINYCRDENSKKKYIKSVLM